MTEIRLPQFDVNSDQARLVAWEVEDGAIVRKGQILCSLETTKAIQELHAEASGILVRKAEAGQEIRFHQIIGYLASDDAAASSLRSVPATDATKSPTQIKATKRAIELARKHDLDLASIATSGVITEADIQARIRSTAPASRLLSAHEPPANLKRVLVIPGGVRRVTGDRYSAERSTGPRRGLPG